MNQQDIQAIFTLSPQQQGLLFQYLQGSESGLYIEQFVLKIQSNLNLTKLQDAVNQWINANEILRTVFVYEKVKEPVQVILKEKTCLIQFENITHLDKEIQDLYLTAKKENLQLAHFQLNKDTLLKINLFQLTENEYQFIFTYPHILLDGWSAAQLFSELLQLYFYPEIIISPKTSYQTYVKWLKLQDNSSAKFFWKNYLSQIEEPTLWNKNANILQKYNSEFIDFELDKMLSDNIYHFCNQHKITPNSFFQAIISTLLSAYFKQDKLVIGNVFSGRPVAQPQFQETLGCFVQTLPLIHENIDNQLFVEKCKSLQQQLNTILPHSHLALQEINQLIENLNPLFDTIIAYENYPFHQIKIDSFNILDKEIYTHTHYPLNFIIFPDNERFNINIRYQNQVFQSWEIVLMQTQIMQLMTLSLTENITVKNLTHSIKYHSFEQIRQVPSLIQTKEEQTSSLISLFERTAQQFPQQIALTEPLKNQTFTYQTLEKEVNKVANFLFEVIDNQIDEFSRIAVLADRSAEMVITFLAILKVGACYVPIEINQPLTRIKDIILDAKPRFVIEISTQLLENESDIKVINYHKIKAKTININAIFPIINPEKPAYMIYTSGTTGKPKGCMISHENVVALLKNTNNTTYFNFNNQDTWIMAHSPAFDFSVWEMYGALCTGAKLVLIPQTITQNIEAFYEILVQEKITILNQTPQAFYALIEYDNLQENNALSALKYVIFGGDKLTYYRLKNWIKKYPLSQTQLINMYGITETTVHTTYYCIKLSDVLNKDSNQFTNIGNGFTGVEVAILDENLQPLQVGFIGEIYVSGAGVSLGYFERETLNTERFISINDKIWYKSGDLARWNKDGEIEYLGRDDKQIKIRGYRIEIAEIEQVIRQISGVKDTVLLFDKSNQTLTAYLILTDKNIVVSSILADKLPAYMLPQHYVILDEFPLTTNGKIDKKALQVIQPNENKLSIITTPEFTENKQVALKNAFEFLFKKVEINAQSHFFQLGGDSIKAIQLISFLRKDGYLLSVKDVFETPNFTQLAEKLQEIKEEKQLNHDYQETNIKVKLPAKFKTENIEFVCELSPAQMGIWLETQKNTHHLTYIEQFWVSFKGEILLDILIKSYQQLVAHHSILRTIFYAETFDNPLQIALKEVKTEINHYTTPFSFTQILQLERSKPFQLENQPPIRLGLFIDNQTTNLVFTHHHILLDGWSLQLLMKDFFAILTANLTKTSLQLPNLTPYPTYIHTINKLDKAKSLEFWKYYLLGYEDISVLPTYQAKTENYLVKEELYEISEQESFILQHLAQKYQLTLNTIFQVAWAILLQRYNRQEDVVFGTVFNGRNLPIENVENMIGLMIQTLPIRVKTIAEQNIFTICKSFQDNWIENQSYFYCNLAEIQAQTSLQNELFSHILVFENYPTVENLFQGFPYKVIDNQYFEQTQYPLNVIIYPNEAAIKIKFLYNQFVFQEGIFEEIFTHFITVLRQFISQGLTSLTVKHINLTNKIALNKIHQFNKTTINYPENNQNIAISIIEKAQNYPHKIALKDDTYTLTYQQLTDISYELANHFIYDIQLQVNDKIAVLVERDISVSVSLLVSLLSGCVYTPIENSYPTERINYMLIDANPHILIVDKANYHRLTDLNLPKNTQIYLLEIDKLIHLSTNINFNPPKILPHYPSFLIYTSGSTGKPKGVLQTHLCLSNLITWQCENSDMKLKMNVLQNSALGFDASIHEILFALLSGGTIISIKEDEKKDLIKLQNKLRKEAINLVWLPISLLNTGFEIDGDFLRHLPDLQYIVATGEQLKMGTALQQFLQNNPQITLYNFYGPSETHVVTSLAINHKSNNIKVLPPIGKPISNTYIYVLDKFGNILPPFVLGELYLGGANVAQGYQNLPHLTNERFINLPFHNALFYKSGDLGYYDNEGNLHFIGRTDDQLKIRGFRVEISEVESVLASHNSVSQGVVVAYEGVEKILIAFLQLKFTDNPQQKIIEIRDYLRTKLPDFMIPTYFEVVKNIPLTQNGKIDKRNLLTHFIQNNKEKSVDNEHVVLAKTERELADIWELILGKKIIKPTTDFFLMGGHSLKAMQVLAKIQQNFNLSLSIKAIFAYTTLERLAQHIEEVKSNEKQIFLTKTIDIEDYPASLAQQKIWAHQQLTQDKSTFIMEIIYQIEGDFEIQKLEIALLYLLQTQPILRTYFIEKEGNLFQKIGEIPTFYTENSQTILATEVFKVENLNHKKLKISLHHLISDGVSNQILMQNLLQFYSQKFNNELNSGFSYFDYCIYEQQLLKEPKFLTVKQPLLNDSLIPTHFDQQNEEDRSVWVEEIEFSTDFYHDLTTFCEKNSLQAAYFWLSLICLWKRRYTHQNQGIVGFAVQGRFLPETQNMIGLFADILPVEYHISEENNCIAQIQIIQNEIINKITNQNYPFSALYENTHLQVVFNYWNEISKSYTIDKTTFSPENTITHSAKYDIEIQYLAKEKGCALQLIVRKVFFRQIDVQFMAKDLTELANQLLKCSKVGDLARFSVDTQPHTEDLEIDFDF